MKQNLQPLTGEVMTERSANIEDNSTVRGSRSSAPSPDHSVIEVTEVEANYNIFQ